MVNLKVILSDTSHRGAEVETMSKKIWLGPVICWVGLQSLIFVSCSSSAPVVLPAKIEALQSQTQDSVAQPRAAAGEVTLNLSTNQIPESVGRFLVSAKKSAIFDGNNSISFSTQETSGVLSLDKSYDALPGLLPLPAFAIGHTFLPVNDAGTDFWLVNSVADGVDVIRPLKPLTSASEPLLPLHMRASIKVTASVVGYSAEHLLLTSADSLWIVQKVESKLEVSEVGSPAEGSEFISAGVISGGVAAFWFATAEKIWLVQSQGSDWSAREFKIKLSGMSGQLSKLNATFELSGDQLKAKGPVVAQVGDKLGSFGVAISLPTGSGPTNPTPTPGPAMTFSEAQALCNDCHGTASSNRGAKAKLVGTENITTWISNKIVIASEVVNEQMPPGREWNPEEKLKFLNFANNPVQ